MTTSVSGSMLFVSKSVFLLCRWGTEILKRQESNWRSSRSCGSVPSLADERLWVISLIVLMVPFLSEEIFVSNPVYQEVGER